MAPRDAGEGSHVVVDAEGVRRALARIAHEIVEREGAQERQAPEAATPGGDAGAPVLLAGIPTRGVPLARRLAAMVNELGGHAEVLELEVSRHRDDRARDGLATVATLHNPGGASQVAVTGRTVVLVDDVIFHGRTARAALDALTELGRPASVRLAVLVDRGHRELPIRADFVGKNIPTARSDRVEVHVSEVDGCDAVLVVNHG
jgi:pyrimidine operon attenuation protein/uracil phosphoribosyltransferase